MKKHFLKSCKNWLFKGTMETQKSFYTLKSIEA